jgi:hypothetical protein
MNRSKSLGETKYTWLKNVVEKGLLEMKTYIHKIYYSHVVRCILILSFLYLSEI